jgi:hypothetical protein
MRDFKGMKRQRGRNRGGGGGGGGKPQHNANRAFESNGPDNVKVRGAAQSVFERYQQLARDAASAGDRVLAENYLQHAEHYFRTLRAMQPQRPASEILGRDYQASGFDIDFEAEPEEGENAEQQPYEGGEGENQNQNNNGEQRQQRDDRPQGQQRDRYENRDRQQNDRPRDDRQRDDRQQRDDRPQGQQRDDRPRDDRPRDDRPRDDRPQGEGRNRRDRWRERDDRPRGDQPREPVAAEAPAPAPVEAPQGSPMLRSQDGEVSHAPAFLGRAPEPRAEAEDAPKVRRPRAPRAKPAAAEEA